MENEHILKNILPIRKFEALNKFVNQWKNDSMLIGMLLSGSYVHGDAGENADLDVHIVLKETDNWRKRGNLFIEDDTEIEYFINPIKQIEHYFKTEFPHSITSANMFANSVVLIENDPALSLLINLAKKYIKTPIPDPKDYDMYLFKYFLDDLRKDLLDTIHARDEFAFFFISNRIINKTIHIYGKMNKIHIDKPKRLINQLRTSGKADEFVYLLERSIKAISSLEILQEKSKAVIKLIQYTEKLVGGPRPSEYSFTGSCTYN